MEEVAKRVEVDGIQAWWDLDAKEILGDEADQYVKVPDTLDVWFGTRYYPLFPLLTCVRNLPVTQRTCIWKVLTSTVVGSCLP
ncbi:class I tRNA ligase family protein [Escherichia coli]